MLIDAQDASDDITSEPFAASSDIGTPGMIVELVATGTVLGVIQLQGSVDGNNWVAQDLATREGAFASQINIAGGDVHHIRIDPPHPNFYRVAYTATSGAGTLTCSVLG